MVKIVQKDESVLRKIAEEVKDSEFGGTGLKKIIEEMKAALEQEKDGVAIAAPQVGVSKRIFVVSKRVLGEDKDDMVFVNPKITFTSSDKKKMEEGCLSVRWLYGTTRRPSRVTIEAKNEQGKNFKQTGSGLMAQIFQHEMEHLEGILFIDHAKEIREIPPEENLGKK